jgi:hypothetical protein
LVLINAQRGNISLHFNHIDTAWGEMDRTAQNNSTAPERSSEASPASAFSPIVSTYNAVYTDTLPGSLVCTQANPTCAGGDAHAQAVHKYATGTFNLYANQHNRNSINGAGMQIISSVHYHWGQDNAYWNGAQMVYGDAYGSPLADDVVAHEFTHGVTQYESNLFYYYQSGAISESFSDIWGEYYDQTNGQGNDALGVKWLIGEDASGLGAVRSMSRPEDFGDPSSITSYEYYTSGEDNGGVHTNSGVNNKAVYLMVDGGTFNGKTVSPSGWTRISAIYYEAQSKLLTSGADYADLYYALQQACKNLIGQKGIVAATCVEVKDAVDAVEMSGQPLGGNFNVDAPLCESGYVPRMVFTDDLEAGTANWTFSNGAYKRWQVDSPYFGQYAQTGLHSLYADDIPAKTTDASARLKPLFIPANAYLHFAHAYGFDRWYDGGVLEYSINNGATWVDAGPLMQYNGYPYQLSTYYDNPLEGRFAFTGDSHGYISTRLTLASLAGKTVSFRWRMGLDYFHFEMGWWVDNIKLYTCALLPGTFGKASPLNGANTQSLSATISWAASSGATSYEYCYDTTNDGSCSNWLGNGISTSKVLNGLNLNTTYYWHVRAINEAGTTYANGSPTAFWSFTTIDLPGAFDKAFPSDGSTDAELSTTLSWNSSARAASYQYCYDTLDDDQCNRTWAFSPFNIITLSNLGTATTYYWQVRAVNEAGIVEADDGTWNSFTTTSTLPPGTAGVQTWIGTSQQGRYSLASGESLRESYSGVSNGPVRIESSSALLPLIAAERVVYKVNGVPASYTEMMGLPDNQLDTVYWLPWYNNTGDLDTQLRFANVTNSTATVRIYVGDVEMSGSPYTLAPGESTRKGYLGISGGPVKIESDVPIVAAERVVYKVNNVNTSFTEMMALTNSQLDTTYYLPWYNNTELDTQLRFANVSDSTATVRVYIGGEEMSGSPFTLDPGASTRQSFAGINNGPVKIESDVPIVAAERVLYKVNGVCTSFTEMMGLPAKQLETTYWLPWYNNVELDTQLRFANVSDTPATVHVTIDGVEMQGSPFTLQPGASTRQSFAGVNNGPVQIVSDVPIVAAARVVFKPGGVGTSFIEMMGLPDGALDPVYWLPWYNNVELDTQLRFAAP